MLLAEKWWSCLRQEPQLARVSPRTSPIWQDAPPRRQGQSEAQHAGRGKLFDGAGMPCQHAIPAWYPAAAPGCQLAVLSLLARTWM